MPLKRRLIREKVLQVLYAYEISREPIESIIETIAGELKKEQPTFEFAKQLILKVLETGEELDRMIQKRVANWEFNRLAVIDRIILRMCTCELIYFEDIPPKVSINEAIEIARRFSTEKSDKFVNGVLDSILDDLKQNGRLKKTGRGLVETSSRKKTST